MMALDPEPEWDAAVVVVPSLEAVEIGVGLVVGDEFSDLLDDEDEEDEEAEDEEDEEDEEVEDEEICELDGDDVDNVEVEVVLAAAADGLKLMPV